MEHPCDVSLSDVCAFLETGLEEDIPSGGPSAKRLRASGTSAPSEETTPVVMSSSSPIPGGKASGSSSARAPRPAVVKVPKESAPKDEEGGKNKVLQRAQGSLARKLGVS